MNIPAGKITFLFTNIEDSTMLAQKFSEGLPSALSKYHSILQSTIESNNGYVFQTTDYAFCCAFQNADDAVSAAVEAQLKFSNEMWRDVVIKVSIGIHSGVAEWNGKTYMGYITLARTSRVMSAAYGGQILISHDAYTLTKKK